jgi:hypothetical protein
VKAMINYNQPRDQAGNYIRHPSEDIAIEANVMFRNIHPALHKNFF